MTRTISTAAFGILGLFLAGCGSSDSPPPASTASAPGAAKQGGGSSGGPTGPSPELMKGMTSGDYKNATDNAKFDANGKPIPPKDAKETKTDAVVLTEDEIKRINELPDPADRALALAQKVCLVNEEEDGKPVHLGTASMGVPYKEVIKGKTVFLCCKGCLNALKKDPDKYLAKLPK